MEVYCTFEIHKEASSVKKTIVEFFAKRYLEIDEDEILFEDEYYILLIKDSYFESSEQIEVVLDLLILLSLELKSRFSAFSIPDFNITETHYN